MITKEEFIQLTEKISGGTAIDEDINLYNQWYKRYQQERSLGPVEMLGVEDTQKMLYSRILSDIKLKRRVRPLYTRIAAVAIILIVFSSGLYFFQEISSQELEYTKTNISASNDITPGGNKAFLTLADGRKFSLTDANEGDLAEQSGIRITKTADGQLIYTVSDRPDGRRDYRAQNSELQYNMVETPRGGQYQVILPDGTKVWLDAESSLKYPASFAFLQERRVELNGEAYFEVAKDKKHPFIVKTDKQIVEVLGTHFNINSYADEEGTKTTLLEGSVKLSHNGKSILITPGKQARSGNNTFKVIDADVEEVLSWKNGYFLFKDEKIESIMRKISRWYDVEITYKGNLSELGFGGKISRSKNIHQVLKVLQLTQRVHFKVEGRRITVMP